MSLPEKLRLDGELVAVPVLRRCAPKQLFEASAEMRLVVEAGLMGDLADGAGIMGQQPGRIVQPQFPDHLAGGAA